VHAIASPVRKPFPHLLEAADEGLDLLRELMVDEPAPAPPAIRPERSGWTARVQEWTHRASSWGEGPQGAWRAW
jgi:hypothetical protein